MNAINLGTSQCLVISPLNLVKEFQEYQHEYLNLIIFQSYHLWIIFKITIRSPFDHHSITIRSPLISPLYIIISFSSNMFPICSLNVVFAVLPPLTSYFCCLKSHHEITMKNPWFHRKLIDVWCLDPHWWAETVLVKKTALVVKIPYIKHGSTLMLFGGLKAHWFLVELGVSGQKYARRSWKIPSTNLWFLLWGSLGVPPKGL